MKYLYHFILSLLITLTPVIAGINSEIFLRELNNIHGANWKNVIQTPQDQAEVKSLLAKIIVAPKEIVVRLFPRKNWKQIDFDQIQAAAMGEFGHFVSYSAEKQLHPQDLNFLKNLKTLLIS